MAVSDNSQDDARTSSEDALIVSGNANTPSTYSNYGRASSYGMDAAYGQELDIRQIIFEYLRIALKRKLLIIAIMLTSIALIAVHTLMQRPLYTASVRLQIDKEPLKVVEGGEVATSSTSSSPSDLRTQYELLQSRSLADRVVSEINFSSPQHESFFEPRNFSILGSLRNLLSPAADEKALTKAEIERWAARIIMANRSVRPVSGSRLVDVHYTDPSPQRAQRIANTYAKAFIDANLDKRFQANSYAKTFLEDQVKQLKLRLEKSEKALLEFAQKEQIVVVRDKESDAQASLSSASATLGQLASERIKSEEQWRQVENSTAITLPQFLSNQVIDGLRAQRNILQRDYQEKLETFKPQYPQMVQIKKKIAEIDRQLADEMKTIRGTLKAAYQSSRTQEEKMQARVDELRNEVLALQKRSIQYNILKREVDTNRELYNGLLQRYKKVDIAGGIGANNIFVVDEAETPKVQSSPNLKRP